MPDSDVPNAIPVDATSAPSASRKLDRQDLRRRRLPLPRRRPGAAPAHRGLPGRRRPDAVHRRRLPRGLAVRYTVSREPPRRRVHRKRRDASGGMIAPLLFSAEEVAAGHIDHAIRFILPNSRIQYKEYVRPATHGTGSSGWATSDGVSLRRAPPPPLGLRRLEAHPRRAGRGRRAQALRDDPLRRWQRGAHREERPSSPT